MASGALAMSLVVAVGLAAVSFNLARVNQVCTQMRLACEAAALAGAVELLDEGVLYGLPDQQGDIMAARAEAQHIAAQHVIDGKPLVLDLNTNNVPNGDIVVGLVADPMVLTAPFMPQAAKETCNAIVVQATRLSSERNGLPLWFGAAMGVPDADLVCQARASLDYRVVGFRPRAGGSIPVMPILVEQEGWNDQRKGSITPWNDRFAVNHHNGKLSAAPDGLVEIELRIPLGSTGSAGNSAADANGNSGNTPRGARAALMPIGGNDVNLSTFQRQCLFGLSTAELQPCGGELSTTTDGTLDLPAVEAADASWTEALWQMRGQKRVWPLCVAGDASSGRWTMIDFAAGIVVDAYIDEQAKPQQLVICVEPTVMATSTALCRPGIPPNPWIAKLLLSP